MISTVLGDVSFTGGKAEVYINDKYFQTIDVPYIANFQSKINGFLNNRPALTYYQTPLAIISLPENNAGDTKIKVQVTEGTVGLAGLAYKSSTVVPPTPAPTPARSPLPTWSPLGLPTFHIRMKTDAKKTRMNINMKSEPFAIEHVLKLE